MIGERRKNSFCTRLVLILCFAWCVDSQLYPYGSGNGDSSLTKTNDTAQRVDLDRAFPFGGIYHSTLYISDNGVISFDDPVSKESEMPIHRNLPFYYDVDGDGRTEEPDTILAFWADVDISGTDIGNVYYRVSTSTSLLESATNDVRQYFRSNGNFEAQVVIVVTWDQVSFYNQQGSTDPRNTFQAVLIHDGQESFVFFIYNSIEWVVGTKMGGNADTGVYPGSSLGVAVVGFLMSDGKTVKNMGYTQSTLLALEGDSSVGVEGVYAYKVDGTSVIDLICTNEPGTALSITPTTNGMMGGERIYVYGPCWSPELLQTCVFTYDGETIQTVNATVINTNEAYCVPDPFFLVGEVVITVMKEGDTDMPFTNYSVIESGRVDPTVTRENSDSSIWDTAGNALTITWTEDEENFGNSDSALTISVLAYREDNTGPRWEEVYVITNSTADDGFYTFTPTAQSGVTADNAFGVIRITGNAEGRQRVLWSDIHPLGYLLEQSYQDDPFQWASDKCQDWITTDDSRSGNFLENLPPCPCTLDQAEQDVATFLTDPTCYPDGGVDTCSKNEGAIHCFLSAYASAETMSGTKCCYDSNRLLMHSGDTKYAGMSSFSHVRGASPYMQTNLVPVLSYWTNDMIGKYFCCEWSGAEECFEYVKKRPTVDCVDYEPPNNALSFGDPHFITMDRYNFTFNGLGEYTMLRYDTSGAKTGEFDFELQGRQVRSTDQAGNLIDVTQLSAVAMKDKNSDTIFVEASASSGMDVYRKGTARDDMWQSVSFSQQIFTDLQGCSVGVTQFYREVEIYGVIVMFKETGISVHVTYDYGMLAVRPVLPSMLNSNYLSGLLGNMDGDPSNDLERRDSNIPLENPTDEEIFQFGQSWEIESDYNLFRYLSGSDHSDYHNSSFVPMMNVALPTLYPACNSVTQCLFDYEVSNDDAELALATLGAFEAFESSSEKMQKIDACPYLITPLNGSKSYTSDSNKYFEGAQITFRCSEGSILVGSEFRTCVYSAEQEGLVWTGSTGDNECIVSTCGILDTPANGSISLSEDRLTATFACDEGFTMSGSSESVCQDGAWTSGSPTCTAGSPVNVVGIAVGVTFAVIIIILLVVLGVLYYMRNKKKYNRSYPRKTKKPKSTDDRDAELAEPLNKNPTDVRASTRSSSSQKSSEGNTGPSAQIYKPTAISQSSVKYNAGGKGSSVKKQSSQPPEPVKKDTKPEPKPEPKPAEPTPVTEAISKETAKTENAAPPPVAKKPKTPDTLRKDPKPYASSDNSSYAGSTAPSTGYKPPSRDQADVVKGTGLLQNTNITGSGGWI